MSQSGNLSTLTELARQAYEQKRTKECLDLTRAILLIDPENARAHWMRSSIQSQMQQDLDNARALLRQAQSLHSEEDPEEPARPYPPGIVAGAEVPDSNGAPVAAPAVSLHQVQPDRMRRRKRRWLAYASVLVALAVTAADLPELGTRPNPVEAALPVVSIPSRPMTSDLPSVAEVPEPVPEPAPPVTDWGLPAREAPAFRPLPPKPTANSNEPPAIPAANGTLAVSSPASLDIYKDGTYLGSAPVSIDLTAGTHRLEYRHGSLRKTAMHVINSNETTRAMITFEVTVQINSRPWADVFLDGLERTLLGQTPLSGVRVPIGSLLVFENPQFQTKRYRVTGNESRIQIVFP